MKKLIGWVSNDFYFHLWLYSVLNDSKKMLLKKEDHLDKSHACEEERRGLNATYD